MRTENSVKVPFIDVTYMSSWTKPNDKFNLCKTATTSEKCWRTEGVVKPEMPFLALPFQHVLSYADPAL